MTPFEWAYLVISPLLFLGAGLLTVVITGWMDRRGLTPPWPAA